MSSSYPNERDRTISRRALPNIPSLDLYGPGQEVGMPRTSLYAEKRDQLLAIVKAAQISHGKPPSIRALAEELNVGVATLHSYLTQLAAEGLVEWSSGRHRTLRCTELGLREAG